MFTIPNQETKKHLQDNKSDLSGTIFKSRNIDLDEEGYIKLASPTFAVMTTSDDADLDSADAMFPSDSSIYVNSDEMFVGEIDLASFTNRSGDTNPVSPSVEDDVIFFNGTEVVSDGTLIKYQSSVNTWTTVSLSFSASYPIAMEVWESEGVLCVGNQNKVKFVDTSWAVSGTILTLPPDHQVSSLAVQGNTLFIGTRSASGREAKLFTVATIQVGIDYAYGVGTFEIMSVKPFKSSVACLVSSGKLLRFNGGGFDELAQLPIYRTNIEWTDALNDYSTASNRSLAVDGDRIYMNISSATTDGLYQVLPNFPSGVWCYDDRNGSLYHRYGPSLTTIQTETNPTVSTANDTFTVSSLANVVTGMPVLYDVISGTSIPELKTSTPYYIIKDSSTVFRLAETYTDALAGTAIDITGSGSTFQKFFIFLICDYGWTYQENRMSMAVLNNLLFDSTRAGKICIASDLFQKQDQTTKETVINGISSYLPNRGYFVTPRLNSNQLEDDFNNIYIKYAPLKVDDKIIIKYKDIDKEGFPFSSIQRNTSTDWLGTWSDTDTFTTTVDMSNVEAGDEIEIIAGVGAGHIATISSITESSGTYTVNLDEAFIFVNASDLMYFQVDNFKKLGEITSSSSTEANGVYKIPCAKKSKFLQVKIELRGIGVTIEELIINNEPHKLVV